MVFGRFFGKEERAKAPAAREPSKGARPSAGKPVSRPPSTGAAALPAPKAEADDTPVRAPVARKPGLPLPVGGKGVVALRATTKEPDADELASILEFAGRVLSAEGGTIQLQSSQRRFVAALDNDTLLVAKSHLASSPVSAAQAILQRQNFRPARVFHVDLETIRKVYEGESKRHGGTEIQRDTAQMQRAVIDLVRGAAAARCSDIHIIVKRFEAEVRVRSDGVMSKLQDMHAANAQDLCQAAFNMADASDASYKPYEYQGARITALKTPLPEGVQAVRLQFNPLPDGGRYLIMRLLYAQRLGSKDDVDTLGYTGRQIQQIKRMRRKAFGINIISGPTGSGKSTTLQRALTALLRDVNFEKNVITVEDPPEYEIFGAAQLPVTNVKTDAERKEAFRQAITASLRSDPDIVMIGEIRDAASAGLAFQASMTGHQVWASLHANDALSILDRLRDMDVELYRLSDYTLVTGLIGQRLVRTLCPHCKLPFSEGVRRKLISEDQRRLVCEMVGEADGKVFVANPDGCDRCRGGYSGRTVVAEVILPDRKFMDFIAQEKKIEAREYWLDHLAGVTMVENAMLKCVSGLIDPREVEEIGLLDEIDQERFRQVLGETLALPAA